MLSIFTSCSSNFYHEFFTRQNRKRISKIIFGRVTLSTKSVTVPSLGGVGVFNDSTLQTLYDDLLARGNTSLEDALRVGAFIEEIDIADLDTRSAQTDNSDILTVYDNLNRGSRNHLRSFVAQLERANSPYEPQALTAAYYQSIISGDHECGTHN